jgi:hypothetical protein
VVIVDFYGVFNGTGCERQPSMAELFQKGIDVAQA